MCAGSQNGKPLCDGWANLTKLGALSPDLAVFLGVTVIRTFIVGIILGLAGVFAALHFVPVVDQHRESSIVAVSLNGGNSETFHVKVPMDRIMIGAQGRATALPPELVWPEDERFSDLRAELFKLRNSRDAVIGVASRIAANDPELGGIIEWVLHLPARGSVFVRIPADAGGSQRVGDLSAGTREFSALVGDMSERWVPETTGADGVATGRIELLMNFVSTQYELDEDEEGAGE